MDRKNMDKIAATPDDRVLLAKLWDKIQAGIQKNTPAHTGFLSPREQQLAQFLFGDAPGLRFWGGYSDAERKMLVYLPDYLDEDALTGDDSPITCIRAQFYKTENPTHRDFLGALMGSGITRQSIGDIMISDSCCNFLVTAEMAPYILQNLDSAGRASLKLQQIPLKEILIPEQKYSELRDTVASSRLDSILASGFRISRGAAADYIAAGRVSVNNLLCDKPDKVITEGAKISVRGLGKILLSQIGHITKKGRISVVIHRYE